MGWFDEQIKQRIENDDALFTEGFSAIGNAVIGKKILDDGQRAAGGAGHPRHTQILRRAAAGSGGEEL